MLLISKIEIKYKIYFKIKIYKIDLKIYILTN